MVNSPTFPEDFIVLPLGQRVFGLVTYVMIIMVSFDVLGIKQIQRNGCPVMASGFAVLIRLMSRHDMSRSTGVHVSDKFSILFSVKLFVKFQHWTAQKKMFLSWESYVAGLSCPIMSKNPAICSPNWFMIFSQLHGGKSPLPSRLSHNSLWVKILAPGWYSKIDAVCSFPQSYGNHTVVKEYGIYGFWESCTSCAGWFIPVWSYYPTGFHMLHTVNGQNQTL